MTGLRSNQRREDWISRARQADLLETAIRYGAVLKRKGKEHVGPCPGCGGTDRFSINPSRHLWHCRGHAGGGYDAAGMVMHIGGMSFLQAVQDITGEPPPDGPARPLSDAEKAARAKRKADGEAAQRVRLAQEKARDENSREYCARVFAECLPIAGTLAEKYLRGFMHPVPPDGWPDCLAFHPALPYPGCGKLPALVARVDDLSGDITGIWREFISPIGGKAEVESPKLGLGPVAGGAVRLGGVAEHIGLAEGLRTSLGAWCLNSYRFPVWACLSTSGLVGLEVPLIVKRVTGFPDGDRPMRRKPNSEEYIPAEPAGRKAMQALWDRIHKDVAMTIAAEPPPLVDYENLMQAYLAEET